MGKHHGGSRDRSTSPVNRGAHLHGHAMPTSRGDWHIVHDKSMRTGCDRLSYACCRQTEGATRAQEQAQGENNDDLGYRPGEACFCCPSNLSACSIQPIPLQHKSKERDEADERLLAEARAFLKKSALEMSTGVFAA